MSETTIRTATAQDIPALALLYRHLIPDEPSVTPELGRARLEQLHLWPPSAIFVADKAGVLVSSVTLIVVPNMTRQGAPYAFIENVVTHQAHRRQGLAQQVLAKAEARAWAAGCYRIMIVSGNHNTSAHAAYRKAGYQGSKTGFQKRKLPDRTPQ